MDVAFVPRMQSRSLRSFHVPVIALFTLLAACTTGCSGDGRDDLGQTTQDVTEVCGAKTTGSVQGVDVSHYQGNFDWKAASVQFGYAQVSDGISNPDATFDQNWANMKAANVLRGAYQYFEPAEDEVAQANMVVSKVGKLQPGDLPAMIDVETTGNQTPGVMTAKIKKWLQVVEAGTGAKPFIYTGSYFWQDNVGDMTLASSNAMWIAAYGPACPSVPPGFKDWLFWQYSDGDGKLDHDVFNGTLAQLRAYSPLAPSADAGARDASTGEGADAEADAGARVPAKSDGGDDGLSPDAGDDTSEGMDQTDASPTQVSFDPTHSGGCSVTSGALFGTGARGTGGSDGANGPGIVAGLAIATALLRKRRRHA